MFLQYLYYRKMSMSNESLLLCIKSWGLMYITAEHKKRKPF